MIVAAGTLNTTKRFDVLLDALARIATPATLVIGGEGTDLEALRRHAGAAGMKERVRFTGHVDPAAIPEYFAAAEVFVHPAELKRQATSCSKRSRLAAVSLSPTAAARPNTSMTA